MGSEMCIRDSLRMELVGVTQDRTISVNSSTNEITQTFSVVTTTEERIQALTPGTTEQMVFRLLDGSGQVLGTTEFPMEVVAITAPDSIARELARSAQDLNSFIAEPTKEVRIYSLPNYTETIPARADLDGNYLVVLRDTGSIGYGNRGVDVDSVRVYIQGSDLSTTEIHREAWTLLRDRRTIQVNISTAEESGAAGKIQRLSLIHI